MNPEVVLEHIQKHCSDVVHQWLRLGVDDTMLVVAVSGGAGTALLLGTLLFEDETADFKEML